jgi:hypothetical protein
LRCPRCGNENSERNRFCGMCGASLITAPATVGAPSGGARAEQKPEITRVPEEPRLPSRHSAVKNSQPSGTVPSFLGLNDPADGQRGSRDSHGRSSESVDYLLEDEEEPRSGWGKLVVVLIALVLAGAFGYLRWRQGGFDWVLNQRKTTPTAESSPTASTTPAASSPTTSDSTANNATPSAAPNAVNTSSASPPPATENAPVPATTPEPSTTPPANTPASTPAGGAASESAAPATNVPTTKAAAPTTEKSTDDNDDAAKSEPEETKPAPAPRKLRKPTPATPIDVSAEAERYIYGRGVPQDCDRGLRLLKSAAQSDANAMIKMGVLYSTGTCAPHDLPSAYRWFAMALHKQPNNQALQDDLQQIWGQMTPPERQLAIKMSQ